VLLYMGTTKEAMACAERLTGLPRHFCPCRSRTSLGHPDDGGRYDGDWRRSQGKYVGVAGVFHGKDGKPEFRYQFVGMTEEFLTPGAAGREPSDQQLMEEYTPRAEEGRLLGEVHAGRHPVQLTFKDATYVGSGK